MKVHSMFFFSSINALDFVKTVTLNVTIQRALLFLLLPAVNFIIDPGVE